MRPGYERVALDGKRLIVTGGGSGMGESAAHLLASRGASVAVVDINAEGAEKTASAIRDAGGTAVALPTDITNEAAVKKMVADTVSELGGLDGAFNNAGIIGPAGKIRELTFDQWQSVLDINLNGCFLCLKYEIEHLAEAGSPGAIVNTASTAGAIAYPNLPAYVASKHAVVGLTRQVGLDYARSGIRVNAVLPGSTMTPLAAEAFADPELKAAAEAAQPIGRLGEAYEIAEMAAWLLSDAASFAVGSAYFVDGGVSAA